MKVHLTLKSTNAKTGPIPVSTTSSDSCPPTCPLRGAGCYAEHGKLSMHWAQVTNGTRGQTWKSFCAQIESLPPNTLWRHNQAGDLPGRNNRINPAALGQLVRANTGKRGFTYTHYPTTPHNLAAIAGANAAGFTINLSANNPSHADQLSAHGLPVVTLLPADTRANLKLYTPAGRRIVVCPATYRTNVTCSTCKLCAVQRRPIIGFPAHGTGSARVSTLAR